MRMVANRSSSLQLNHVFLSPCYAFEQVFTPWGMLSGALFVLSTGCTFFAIDILGISFSSAIWSGTAIIASFTWGIR